MMRLVKKLCTWKIIPITWTALTIILLCIPGTAIPSEGVFATDGIDKVVHVILFGGIVLLWGFNLYFRRSDNQKWRQIIVMLTLFSVGLGIGLEFLQRDYGRRSYSRLLSLVSKNKVRIAICKSVSYIK
jgi:hypothetical protein